jgi:hypothetical protein
MGLGHSYSQFLFCFKLDLLDLCLLIEIVLNFMISNDKTVQLMGQVSVGV